MRQCCATDFSVVAVVRNGCVVALFAGGGVTRDGNSVLRGGALQGRPISPEFKYRLAAMFRALQNVLRARATIRRPIASRSPG